MKTLYTTIFLLIAGASLAQGQQTETARTTEPGNNLVSAAGKSPLSSSGDLTKERARIAIPELVRAVFSSKVNGHSVTLSVDAGWRDDSLSVEYKYYREASAEAGTGGTREGQLIEKIYFTFLPQDITGMSTETDELLFLYLSSKKEKRTIRKLVSGAGGKPSENSKISSFGFPVRAGNLEALKKSLKELQ